eukprot:119460_1
MATKFGLIPGTRDLYFILHDILSLDYALIPPLYDANKQCIQGEDWNYHSLLLLLSSAYFDETERNDRNLQKIMKIGIDLNPSFIFLKGSNIIHHIIAEVASFCTHRPFQFDTSVLGPSELQQLTLNDKLNTVYFDKARRDFINVINNRNLLDEDCDGQTRIDTFVLGRRSEMWIGIIDKAIYAPYDWVENNEKSLFYYYKHRLHAFGKRYWMKLDSKYRYDQYHWVSFVIDKKQQTITFYHNKEKVVTVNELPKGDEFVYNGILDTSHDGFYVEKVMFAQ